MNPATTDNRDVPITLADDSSVPVLGSSLSFCESSVVLAEIFRFYFFSSLRFVSSLTIFSAIESADFFNKETLSKIA